MSRSVSHRSWRSNMGKGDGKRYFLNRERRKFRRRVQHALHRILRGDPDHEVPVEPPPDWWAFC